VNKHIFNKHEEVLDEKFNKVRFEQMLKENYFNDPRKLINQPNFIPGGPSGSGYSREGGPGYRGGYSSSQRGGGYRRYEERGEGERSQQNANKRYYDYDDPAKYQQQHANPERQLVSYDDLF
jgi:hypothetical protein